MGVPTVQMLVPSAEERVMFESLIPDRIATVDTLEVSETIRLHRGVDAGRQGKPVVLANVLFPSSQVRPFSTSRRADLTEP